MVYLGKKTDRLVKLNVHNSSAETHIYFNSGYHITLNALCNLSNRISQSATYDKSKYREYQKLFLFYLYFISGVIILYGNRFERCFD